jgi:hypothetical protein
LKENGVEMPISVKIHCKGLSYKKLTLSDNAFSAVVLQESYNEVHGLIDGDDITLSGITFTGNTLATGPATNLQWGQDDEATTEAPTAAGVPMMCSATAWVHRFPEHIRGTPAADEASAVNIAAIVLTPLKVGSSTIRRREAGVAQGEVVVGNR